MESRKRQLVALLENAPVIAAVKNDEGLAQALQSSCEVVFILYGNLCTIGGLVSRVRESGKLAFVHLDLVDGLANREIVVDYIKGCGGVDGIISIKSHLIRRAKELDLVAIQRFFLMDSLALDNVIRQSSNADAVEILPATLPKVITRLAEKLPLPLIAGGLISDKEDIIAALRAGAMAVSATNPELWFL